MLGRDNDRIYSYGLVVVVLYCYLSFSVGSQVGESTVFANLGESFCKLVRKRDRHRHKLGSLVACKSEHHTLVARANFVVFVGFAIAQLVACIDAHGNIGRLVVYRGKHGASIAVKTTVGAVVADTVDNISGDRINIDIAVG